MEDKKKFDAIVNEIFGDAEIRTPTENTNAPNKERPILSIVVNGQGKIGQVVHGDVHNTYHVEKPAKPTVIVQTGVGTVSAAQKRQLLDLRDEVVATSEVRKTPKTPASVMLALNKYMKVNTYSEILSEDFDKAQKYLKKQRAIQTGMRSAPQKLPEWRNLRIKAIHSRCREKGFEDWRLTHMKKNFDKESMLELSDTDLEKLYRTVMSKK